FQKKRGNTFIGLFMFICLFHCMSASVLEAYIKTEGAWIFSLVKNEYSVKTALDCALKCSDESDFTCRSFMYIEKDQECITLPVNSKMELILRRMNIVLYERREYMAECKNGIGSDYRGTISKTLSGKTCQKWESNYPQKPNITPTTHPNSNLEYNFCRNPDGDSNGPWCYTTDPEKRWEHCNIQDCSEECMHCSGEDYRGKTSTTENGYTCQRWDSQKPNAHGYIPEVIPEKFLEENYCRNPDGEPRPWCFTTSSAKRWDYCAIARCGTAPPKIVEELTCATGDGTAYRGNVAVTESGKTCQMWDSQTPHKHSRTPENYPCKGLTLNHCRNPDNERMPWCYTTDPDSRWEYCKVPSCGDVPSPIEPVIAPESDCYEGNGTSYRGVTSETISGKKCQFWTSMQPHTHKKTPQSYPNADLRRNYCRNPDGDRAPWCYTTDPTVRWEFCKVQKCEEKPVVVVQEFGANVPQMPQPTEANQRLPAAEEGSPSQKCCKDGNGQSYRGPASATIMGVTCQAWSSMTPHQHASFTPESHPDKGLESNQCRNPDSDVNGPWCYTTDPNKKWDYCSIPDCASEKCGQPKVKPRRCFGRIVGGCKSTPHSWPWQISLRTSTGLHFCGGTLIKPQWVVTAAHCLERSKNPGAYKVYLGIHTERATEPSKQVLNLEKLILGPVGTDIALLKLERPAIINDQVQTVCLPEKDYIVPSNTECYVTGWGETQDTGGEGILKETGFPVIENKVCNRPAYLAGRVKDHEMCAGNIEGGTDSCQGDSGGPLVCYSKDSFVLQGVTSWGLGCANPMKPGVYTRVSKFVTWIEDTIKRN
uniref:Plasminogen n=1 Tax=Paramormyrops kingsleyae TaxID=1676925 RepID=A0A3B3T3H8_9TELE